MKTCCFVKLQVPGKRGDVYRFFMLTFLEFSFYRIISVAFFFRIVLLAG